MTTWSGCWRIEFKCLAEIWDAQTLSILGFILLSSAGRIHTNVEGVWTWTLLYYILAKVTHFYAAFSFLLMGTREVYFPVPSIDHSLSLRFVGGGMGHWPSTDSYTKFLHGQIANYLKLLSQISQRCMPNFRTSFYGRERKLASMENFQFLILAFFT